MDARLLRRYEGELAYMRDMGAEFAAAHPKIAARLGLDGVEVADPYVERLLEGVAFLSARVQLELDLQFPALTSHLLEIVYPHYLAPTPSMMIAALEPDADAADLAGGHVLARGTELRSRLVEGGTTPCVFRTAQDVTLWPVEIAEAEYVDGRGALLAAGMPRGAEGRAAIRLRLRRAGGQPLAELPLDALSVFVDAQEGRSWALHELLATQVTGLMARSTDPRDEWAAMLPEGAVAPRGFAPEEALLPTPRASFDGYRLLQEYFAMPERYHFVEVSGLAMAVGRAKGAEVDVYLLLGEGRAEVAPAVAPGSFRLYATPAANLFTKRCDRVRVTPADVEHHVVPERTAPLDYEVHAIERVTGISGEGAPDVPFRPFYSESDLTAAGDTHPAYYTQARRVRRRAERERLRGARTSYLGSEVYLSLVDRAEAPYPAGLEQLSVTATVTNRDLPLLLPTGARDVFHLPGGGPVRAVATPVGPTRPRPTLAQGDAAWRLVSHLSLNYLSLADTGEAGAGAAALRELVGLYAPPGDRVLEKQIEGLVGVTSRPIVRRMADGVLSTAVRGLEITLTFDETFFEGTSVHLMASVLERFFRKYVTINAFTETVLVTHQRGEVARWRPAPGLGRTL